MLKKIGLGLAAAVVLLVIVIATRPADFKVSRSRTLAAAPEVVFAWLDDFHRWHDWSPWEKLDPGMKREVGGAPSGTGATYHWVGNDKVGEGRMTITDSQPPRTVTIRLEFLKPFAATNTTLFELAPSGTGTTVTWTMSGHNNFMAKAFSMLMDMDATVGPDFERGLANLDAATASAASAPTPSAPAPAAVPAPAPTGT
ncbi:MAG: SRPBCC family protein [Deltaproteobacteria bacterium]|nr:SRPBCC family protein [Deltaproteobacteria bacterium]